MKTSKIPVLIALLLSIAISSIAENGVLITKSQQLYLSESARITVLFDEFVYDDILTLTLYDEIFLDPLTDILPRRSITSRSDPQEKRKFVFEIHSISKKFKYFSIGNWFPNCRSLSQANFLRFYIMEPGDDVTIAISGFRPSIAKLRQPRQVGWDFKNATFSGPGYLKYTCKYENDLMPYVSISKADSLKEVCLTRLYAHKRLISNFIFTLLEVDIIGKYRDIVCDHLGRSQNGYFKIDSSNYSRIDSLFRKHLNGAFQYGISEDLKSLSKNYFQSEYNANLLEYNLTAFKKKEFGDFLKFIDGKYSGVLKEKLLTAHFIYKHAYMNNSGEVLANLIRTIDSDFYKELLLDFRDNLAIGSKAPDFSLTDANNNLVNLKDYDGKVVLLDFWFTGCGGCAQFYNQQLSKAEDYFRTNDDVVFISVSIDEAKERWLDGIRSGKYTSSEVVNLFTDGKGSNHSVIRDYKVFSYPRPIIIDRSGRVFENNAKEIRNLKNLIKFIEAALQL